MSDNLDTLRRRSAEATSSPEHELSHRKFSLPSVAKLLPWILVAAFVLLAWWLFSDRFERGREVVLNQVVTVRAQDSVVTSKTSTAEVTAAEEISHDGPTLFQASGWIEPDPLLLRATTLYSGVVESVEVLEGEHVVKGQVLATMVAEDAELDLLTAQAQLAEAEAQLASSHAELEAGQAAVSAKQREVAAAEARLNELLDESRRLQRAGKDVFRESRIVQTALQVESQNAVVEATRATVKEAEAELKRRRSAIEQAKATIARAKAELGRRELALARTRIVSPVNGRIQRLYAAPGKKRMLAMDDPESATIATLYEPDQLQARIDVPLEEAAQIVVGQPVRLRSTLLPDRVFKGRVTRIDGEADLQRNTLQAKVEILDPADKLRPEMLCRAEFLPIGEDASNRSGANLDASSRVALYLPDTALVRDGNSLRVWVLDASGKAIESRELQIGEERREDYVRVLKGIRPGDWVVNRPAPDLQVGERVKNVGNFTTKTI